MSSNINSLRASNYSKTTNYSGAKYTDRGTAIADSQGGLGKNSFLQILAAELSNLDPAGDVDSTKYVSQMAEFAALEQMQNMSQSVNTNTYYSLVGKGITTKSLDSTGEPYTGIIKGVTHTNLGAILTVEINNNGTNELKEFAHDDIDTIVDIPDYNYTLPTLSNINGNMTFWVASSLIGKEVETSAKDSNGENISGKISSVSKDSGDIKIKLDVDNNGETNTIEVAYSEIIKVSDKNINDVTGNI